MTASKQATYWAPRAWIQGRWESDVLLRVDAQGRWAEVRPGVPKPPRGAKKLPGPVLPSLVNAHSHAFQRAFAGMAERRESAHDDFWSWRDRMYGVALTITPERMLQVATHLYRELRAGGYGHVCEFHYLHHDINGKPYADPLTMSHALIQAAHDAGIGITLLPVLYERAGFDQPTLRDDQRRFATTVDSVLAMREGIRACKAPHVNVGVAIHSLRAARPESITRLVEALQGDDGPIHIHIAEQTGEVDDCLAATGHRPIGWLLRHVRLDARWQLVHATHATPDEIEGVARTGAGIVICPTTEANLGDGLPDLPRWLAAKVPIAIGSDSHVCRDWREELRWMEYGQRLVLRRRNVCADLEGGYPSTAERLFELVRQAGAAAAGFAQWGLSVEAPANHLLLDTYRFELNSSGEMGLLDNVVFDPVTPVPWHSRGLPR
jgi:formimidoylglutamate deiminase